LSEYILSPANLNLAYKQVKSNKGSGRVDKTEVKELLPYLQDHKDRLIQSVYDSRYHPNPVRRVEILKTNRKKRSLGIPKLLSYYKYYNLYLFSAKYSNILAQNTTSYNPSLCNLSISMEHSFSNSSLRSFNIKATLLSSLALSAKEIFLQIMNALSASDRSQFVDSSKPDTFFNYICSRIYCFNT